MSKYDGERVLVIKRELFDQLGAFNGLSTKIDHYLPRILDPANNFFLLRDEAEDDPSHKQIIPYAVFHHEGRYLHYVRGSGSGEQRLASKGSIGIGGHINASDFTDDHLGRETYDNGVAREINEELRIDGGGSSHSIIALLNDDTTAVGQVHLGVVHRVELDSDDVRANEDAITQLEFLTLDELEDRRDQLETWSRIALDALH